MEKQLQYEQDPFGDSYDDQSIRNGERRLSEGQWRLISLKRNNIGWAPKHLALFLRLYSQHKYDEGQALYVYTDNVLVQPRPFMEEPRDLMTSAEAHMLIQWFVSLERLNNGDPEKMKEHANRKLETLMGKYPEILKDWEQYHASKPTQTTSEAPTSTKPSEASKKCPKCQADYSRDPQAEFCDDCGLDLVMAKCCPICDKELPKVDAKFCRYCRAPQQGQKQEQRKQEQQQHPNQQRPVPTSARNPGESPAPRVSAEQAPEPKVFERKVSAPPAQADFDPFAEDNEHPFAEHCEAAEVDTYQRVQWFARLRDFCDMYQDEYRQKIAELREGTMYEGKQTHLPYSLHEYETLVSHFVEKEAAKEEARERENEQCLYEDLERELAELFPADFVSPSLEDEMWALLKSEESVENEEPYIPTNDELNAVMKRLPGWGPDPFFYHLDREGNLEELEAPDAA